MIRELAFVRPIVICNIQFQRMVQSVGEERSKDEGKKRAKVEKKRGSEKENVGEKLLKIVKGLKENYFET